MSDVLGQTIAPEVVNGNVLDNDTGVDAPLSLQSVEYGGTTHTFASDGATVTFTISDGGVDFGEVEINSDGSYVYTLYGNVDINSLMTAVVDYVAQDNDGDSDSATLTLNAAPRVDVASITADSTATISEDGPTSQSFTVNLASAPLATQSFVLSLGAVASGDATVSVSGASYNAVNGVVTVAAGVASFGVVVTAVDDNDIEGTEQTTLTVDGASIDIDILDNDSYNIVGATVADDSLTGLVGYGDEFVWELPDVVNTSVPASPVSLGSGNVSMGESIDWFADGSVDEESSAFEVDAGEVVTIDFDFNAQELEDNGFFNTRDGQFAWRVEKWDGNSWEDYDAQRVFNESDATDGSISGLVQSVTVNEAGQYRLEFDTDNGAFAQINNITLTRTPNENIDTVTNFELDTDVLNISDVLGGGAMLSLNFDNGDAQLVITDAGGNDTDQIINLAGVSQTDLQNGLSLSASADETDILNALVAHNVIVDN